MGGLLVSTVGGAFPVSGTGGDSGVVMSHAGELLGLGGGGGFGAAASEARKSRVFFRDGASTEVGSTRFEMRLRGASIDALPTDAFAAPLAEAWLALSVCRLHAI